MCRKRTVSIPPGDIFCFREIYSIKRFSFCFALAQVFGQECEDPKYILIDEKLKEKFVDIHNELRNNFATGNHHLEMKDQIADMATMV